MSEATLRPLLQYLSDGAFHSGEELGQQLGISRAAVWKQIQQLETLGIELEAQKGLGYRLLIPLDLLDKRTIKSFMTIEIAAQIDSIQILFETNSTNDVVLQCLREECTAPFVVLAEKQSAGRGRRGRAWYSPFGSSIYFSLGWTCSQGLAAMEGLSLIVGLKVVEALECFGVSGLQLKWPNDILWQGRKLAGILIDVQGDPLGETQLAIGIGLNVHLPLVESERHIDQAWVDCQQIWQASAQIAPTRNQLVAKLLERLLPALNSISPDGFSHYHDHWQARDAFMGQDVVVQIGREEVRGRGCGVNAQGAYVLETSAGPQLIVGGEISLRRAVKNSGHYIRN